MMRILIIDADQDLGVTVQRTLASQGFAVDYSVDGIDALQNLREVSYDLVLLDYAALGPQKEPFLKDFRFLNEHGAIFILSTRCDEESKLWGFQHGADDYIVKPFYLSELVARVRHLFEHRMAQVVHGGSTTSVLVAGDLRADLITGEVKRKTKPLTLRPKEYAILIYLIKRVGQIVTHQEINQHVWNLDFDPQSARLEAHISRLRAKLAEGFKSSPIETVTGRGYRLTA